MRAGILSVIGSVSPVRYDQLSPSHLKLVLMVMAATTASLAVVTAVSWLRLARPRPRIGSYAGVGHALLVSAIVGFAVACIVTVVRSG